MVLGLTGKYCAGKSTVSSYLAKRGWLHIDVDKLGHEVLEQEKQAVAGFFGPVILKEDGSVDRQALGAMVFADSQKLAQLERILHPAMKSKVAAIIQDNPKAMIVIDAAILFSMGLHELCQQVIFVSAPQLIRYRRAVRRDGVGIGEFLKRNRNQRHIRSQAVKDGADIHNVSNWFCRNLMYQKIDAIVAGKKEG